MHDSINTIIKICKGTGNTRLIYGLLDYYLMILKALLPMLYTRLQTEKLRGLIKGLKHLEENVMGNQMTCTSS